LDLVWNGALYLGNGDGTFQQAPLGISGTPLAIADLNGDGIPDLLMVGAPGTAAESMRETAMAPSSLRRSTRIHR
jgi:FG-GAP-like repeat